MKEWLKLKEQFEIKNVHQLKGNFLPPILKKAQGRIVGKVLCIMQSFEPISLNSALAEMGYEYETDKVSETEYSIYFYRHTKTELYYPGRMDVPLRPIAIINFNTIDPKLSHSVVNFWQYIWGQENPSIDMKTRLLLSLSNGVGAGKMRQAVREFVKVYFIGVTTADFDELIAMFAWNQGIGYFASEIGPSALFAAYKYIKNQEEKGIGRYEIVKGLMEKFGEENPDSESKIYQQKPHFLKP